MGGRGWNGDHLSPGFRLRIRSDSVRAEAPRLTAGFPNPGNPPVRLGRHIRDS